MAKKTTTSKGGYGVKRAASAWTPQDTAKLADLAKRMPPEMVAVLQPLLKDSPKPRRVGRPKEWNDFQLMQCWMAIECGTRPATDQLPAIGVEQSCAAMAGIVANGYAMLKMDRRWYTARYLEDVHARAETAMKKMGPRFVTWMRGEVMPRVRADLLGSPTAHGVVIPGPDGQMIRTRRPQ